jgi:periplasmic protein TonB
VRVAADTLLGWPVLSSLGVHVVALSLAPLVAAPPLTEAPPERLPVAVEIVRVEPPPPPPAPPRERVIPRRPAPTPMAVPKPPEPPPMPALMDDRPLSNTLAANVERPTPGPLLPTSGPAITGPPAGGPAGAGRLFDTGDIVLRSGVGTNAGGRAGTGTGASGAGNQVALSGGGVTELARPLGGYQTTPRYPETARREGIEGVATLRFQVLTSGEVGTVTVAQSAGHRALDRAAVEAIKTWRFEPARRGKEAVTVWVTLPVRFELTTR